MRPAGTADDRTRAGFGAARRTAQCAALVVALMAMGSPGAAAGPRAPADGGRYALPLPHAQVVAGFDAEATTYGPGHRGVDLLCTQGDPVAAAAAGVVAFAGAVAGRGVVVILHPDGIRTTYEPVDPQVPTGSSVARGQVIAEVAGDHRGRADVLHWGARRGDAYLDPLRLIRALGVVRLIPAR